MERISDIYQMIRGNSPKTVAVAGAADREVLTAIKEARACGIIRGELYGDEKKIREILYSIQEDPQDYKIIQAANAEEEADMAVRSVSGGTADILMKGLMNSSTFIRAVLNKEYGLRKAGSLLSAMAAVEVTIEGTDRLLFIADPGFIPAPDLQAKKEIISGCVEILHAFGYDNPKVAVLSAAETANPKMVSSTDAQKLEKMWEQGEIKGCTVGGPLSLDLAISKESVRHKKFVNPVAGEADLLLVPTIEVGNVLLKSITFIMKAPAAGAVAGTTKPVVFTSRSDSAQTKQNTIAAAVLLSERMKNGEREV